MLPVTPSLVKVFKKAFAALRQQASDDAAYHDRKALQARASAQLLKDLAPILTDMLKPPKPIKLKRISKRELARLQQLP